MSDEQDDQDLELAEIKGLNFESRFKGTFEVATSQSWLQCKITIVRPDPLLNVHHGFQLPRALLAGKDPAEFFEFIVKNFQAAIDDTLAYETVLLFTDIVNFALLDAHAASGRGGSAQNRNRVIVNHTKKTEERLRAFFRTPEQKRGRFSPWNLVELTIAVTTAAAQVTGRVTADKVARRLQKAHGDIAPPTGKALLQLVARHGLKWEQILEQAKKRQQ
jgi:hypothetical protein